MVANMKTVNLVNYVDIVTINSVRIVTGPKSNANKECLALVLFILIALYSERL